MNRFFILWKSVLFLILLFPYSASGETHPIRVAMQVFRIGCEKVEFTTESLLTDGGAMYFYDGTIKFSEDLLEVDPTTWRWNGVEIPFPNHSLPITDDVVGLPDFGNKLKLISMPEVLTELGKESAVCQTSNPVEYFVSKGGGHYDLRTAPESPELRVNVKTSEDPNKAVALSLHILCTLVLKREPLDGTYLNIGKPIFSKVDCSYKATTEYGRDLAILISNPADSGSPGGLLIRLRVEQAEEGSSSSSQGQGNE